MDKVDSNFEIYVGTKEDMLGILDEKIEVINGNKKTLMMKFLSYGQSWFSVALEKA